MTDAHAAPPPRRRLRLPLGTVLAVGLAAMMAIGVGGTLAIGLYSAGQNTRELLRDKADAEVDLLVEEIRGLLDPVRSQARWIAAQVKSGITTIHDPAFETLVKGALATAPQVFRVAVLQPDRRLRRYNRGARDNRDNGPVSTLDLSDNPQAAAALATAATRSAPYWDAPFRLPSTGQTAINLRTPLWRDGKLTGVLVQVVLVAELSRFIAERAGDDNTSFVLYGRDRVLAHPTLIDWRPLPGETEPLPRLDQVADAVLAAIWTGAPAAAGMFAPSTRSQVVGRQVGYGRYYYAYRPLPGYGPESWIVGVYASSASVEGQVQRVRRTMYMGGFLLLLGLGAGAVAGRLISRPTRRLAALAQLVHDKRLDEIAPLPRSLFREFDDSAAAFNRMVRAMRDRTRVRRMFGRYMPEAVAEALLKDGDRAMVPQVATATVLFVDLENFTAMTERIGPERTVEVLNAYFSAAVAIVEAHKGVVTQFQGDAILAIFNVPLADPNHAADGIAAGRDIVALTGRETFAGETLACRIGITTGPVVAGHVGAEGRLNYTVHGDAVNVASRLEGLNKEYGTRLLVAEATVTLAGETGLRPVGNLPVRGHAEPVRVYTLPDGA